MERISRPKTRTNESESSSHFKILLNHIHPLVSKNELTQFCENILLPSVKITKSNIIYYGPKSTGKGWLEIEANNTQSGGDSAQNLMIVSLSSEGALYAASKLNGLMLRDQAITAELENKNREKNKVRRERKRREQDKDKVDYQEELNQLQAKYKDYTFTKDPPTVSLSIVPSDPDFPFDIEKISLEIGIPENYPNQICTFKVLNSELPDKIKEQMSSKIESRAKLAYKNKPMMMGLIRWTENNLEKLLVSETLTTNYQLEKAGFQFFTPNQILQQDKDFSTPTPPEISKENQSKEEESGNESNEEEEMSNSNANADAKYGGSTAHRGTLISVNNLEIQNVGIVECQILQLVLLCSRCRNQTKATISSPEAPPGIAPYYFAEECAKCKTAQMAAFRRETMHSSGKIMGYLDLEGCQPLELLPCQFVATCLECSHSNTFKKVSFNGEENSCNCLECHSKLSLSLSTVKFEKVRVARVLPEGVKLIKKKKEKDPRMSGIKVGTPLPDKGTCRHYKKSRRWLRFPCCSRVFPCDLCHEENNTDGHEMKWANKMLCGYCSKEQPFSSKPCSCGADLTANGGTHFWEGGQGCRDTKRLSKNDPHKYANKHKTHSQKEKRVGPKPPNKDGKSKTQVSVESE